MANQVLKQLIGGLEKFQNTNTSTFDFVALRVGANNLTIAQASASAFDFNGKIVSNSADGAVASDLSTYGQSVLRSGVNAWTANQSVGGFKFTSLAAGTTAGDSVRYEQAILATGVNAFSANQSMGGNKITNMADPTAAQDGATKAYVDAVAQGLRPKAAVRAASNGANINLASALINGFVLDGVTLATGDRVLVKDQTTTSQNGIYIVAASGAASRATDIDSLSPIDEINGAYTFIQSGSQAGQGWVEQSLITTLGTDPMIWVYFNSVGTIVGFDMISVSGNNISVDLATVSGLESSNPGNTAGQLRIKLEASNPSLKFTGSNEIAAKLDAAGAITSGASGLIVGTDGQSTQIASNQVQVKLDAAGAIVKSASGVAVQLETSNPTLQISTNKLGVKLDAAGGIVTGAAGIKHNLEASNPSLQLSANELGIKFDPAGALTKGAAGTKILVDNIGIEIAANALQLKALGVHKGNLNADVVSGDLAGGLRQATDGSLQIQPSANYINDNAGAITVRQFVYFKANGHVDLAKADAAATSIAALGVVEATSIAAAGTGAIMVRPGTVITGFSGLTPGGSVYLSTATAGAVTQTGPTGTTGQVYRIIGKALDATTLYFNPQEGVEFV